VAVPTIFGVLTTIATFIALSNVEGGMGTVYAQFATIVTICLLLSMVESKLILPSHLAHINTHRKIGNGWKDSWARLQRGCDIALDTLNLKFYQPAIKLTLQYRYAAVLLFVAIFIAVVAMPFAGSVRVAFFPDIPGSTIKATVTMQNDASFGLTHKNLLYLESMAIQADKDLRKNSNQNESAIGTLEVIATGDLQGSVAVELKKDASYDINQFTESWKALSGMPQGMKKLNIQSGFGQGDNFKVELKAWDSATLKQAGEEFRSTLKSINGVSGIDDNFNSGQSQLRFTLTEQAQALGMNTAQLSKQLLQAFGGEIVQRFQRGKDEVKVRVRYPQEARQNIDDILQARVRTPNGDVVPLASLAKIHAEYQQNEITRIGGLPSVYVSASTNKDVISPSELVQKLEQTLVPSLSKKYPDLTIHFAGEAEEQAETAGSMGNLFIIAMLAIFILLAIPLRSYVQPIIIMAAIPFGLVGAILGHWLNDMTLSVLSFNGIVALSGVVVNDSLLLVSRFNDLHKENDRQLPMVAEHIITACSNRLRPVLLTSLTTFAGLMPLLSETSAQAQFIIPAAASLGYGILFATVITLILTPALLMIQHDVITLLHKVKSPNKQQDPKSEEEQVIC
jgi:multidrug efflux pump subunit AcrB